MAADQSRPRRGSRNSSAVSAAARTSSPRMRGSLTTATDIASGEPFRGQKNNYGTEQ
ncbi:hypothetical protein HNR07_001574 [Nocardiopsis metallicus]|uniref:Uncharacterized protein n=1 Tax=Nocardiopsis metallicus TaxID=179819 RepID=A0A840WFE1_9ACTN|nr:hypothetical protein [Nocardiopsis metallicus]